MVLLFQMSSNKAKTPQRAGRFLTCFFRTPVSIHSRRRDRRTVSDSAWHAYISISTRRSCPLKPAAIPSTSVVTTALSGFFRTQSPTTGSACSRRKFSRSSPSSTSLSPRPPSTGRRPAAGTADAGDKGNESDQHDPACRSHQRGQIGRQVFPECEVPGKAEKRKDAQAQWHNQRRNRHTGFELLVICENRCSVQFHPWPSVSHLR